MKTIQLPKIFQDGMVLQRDKRIRIWGQTTIAQTIEVCIGSSRKSCSFQEGAFSLELDPQPLTYETELSIKGDHEAFAIKNVAIGDVYIAGGQSNMEYAMWQDKEYTKELKHCEDPMIRFFDVPELRFEGHENCTDFSAFDRWRTCDKENLKYFSAVGYYFVKRLTRELKHIPIGIVGCNFGGTSASAWMDPAYLTGDLKIYLDAYQESLSKIEDIEAHKKAEINRAQKMTVSGEPLTGIAKALNWILAEGHAVWYEKLLGALITRLMKAYMIIGPYSANRPGCLYENMLSRISGMSAKGVLWYQGESDDQYHELYDQLLSSMIRCWRDTFQEDLPFYIVQLAPLKHWLVCSGEHYPDIRQQQHKVCRTLDKCYIVSIMDAGEKTCIHPRHKRAPGERLALQVLHEEYGVDILCNSPEMTAAQLKKDVLHIEFANVGEGLRLSEGTTIRDLDIYLDGEKKKYRFDIRKNEILIYGNGFAQAKSIEIRMAYVDYTKVNLYNSADLPVLPGILRLTQKS